MIQMRGTRRRRRGRSAAAASIDRTMAMLASGDVEQHGIGERAACGAQHGAGEGSGDDACYGNVDGRVEHQRPVGRAGDSRGQREFAGGEGQSYAHVLPGVGQQGPGGQRGGMGPDHE